MPLTNYAMLIKAPSYSSQDHQQTWSTTEFTTNLVGVSSVEEAIEVTRELIARGVQLVELCGGFSPEDAARIERETGRQVPIGVVRYSEEEQTRLSELFN